MGLWVAEGARTLGEDLRFVDEGRSCIVRAFGFGIVETPSDDCLALGGDSPSYLDEIETSESDRSPRTVRWQRTVGWEYPSGRPSLGPLPPEALAWAEGLCDGRPIVVVAPKANVDARSLPLHKWLRVACALRAEGVLTVAIDGHEDAVSRFPRYAFGFPWPHVLALLDRADVVAGNDSGIPHLAATIGTPTVAAMGPTDPNVVFGHCLDVLRPVLPGSVPCAGCHFVDSRGYQVACDHACEALHALSWRTVADAILETLAQEASGLPGKSDRRSTRVGVGR